MEIKQQQKNEKPWIQNMSTNFPFSILKSYKKVFFQTAWQPYR